MDGWKKKCSASLTIDVNIKKVNKVNGKQWDKETPLNEFHDHASLTHTVELGIVLTWKPEFVSLDFEMEAIQAFLFCFHTLKIIGCWFHFGQCLFRKIVEIGLKTQYGDDEDLKKYIYIYYNIYINIILNV